MCKINVCIETNSIEYRDDILLEFRMSVHNIVRKRKILKRNPTTELIINLYFIFSYILVLMWRFLLEEMSMFCFQKFYFLSVGLFDWGCTRTKYFLVSQNWYGFTLAGH